MKPLKLYVASRWSDKLRVARLEALLRENGHIVTSKWVDIPDNPHTESRAKLRYNVENAKIDWEGVRGCDYLVMYAQPRASGSQGAWVEFGGALALEKGIIILGHEDLIADKDPCVFTWLENVQRVPDATALLAYLNTERGVGLTSAVARMHPYAAFEGQSPISDAAFDEHGARKEDESW